MQCTPIFVDAHGGKAHVTLHRVKVNRICSRGCKRVNVYPACCSAGSSSMSQHLRMRPRRRVQHVFGFRNGFFAHRMGLFMFCNL